jgi:alkanesulfonate monooxygenase SsuD/methylene tetrahydromethanopterin reductase-like flavin-dependent oxidoreductase (luciferase family)
MKLGYGLITCQAHPDDKRSEQVRYLDAIELAVEAENLGFDSVWVSEHHFLDDGYLPSVLPMCAAIAAKTSRITIGTAVALAPLYDPLRLAEDAACVDLIAQGRLILGLGQGWRAEEFDAFRVPLKQRPHLLEDSILTLRQAWSDGVTTGGTVLKYPQLNVRPKPARVEGIPVWIGASAERAIRRAGRLADGYIASGGFTEPFTPDELRKQLSWILEELAAAGRSSENFSASMFLPTFVSRDTDAWQQFREHMYYTYWKYEDMSSARSRVEALQRAPQLSEEHAAKLRPYAIVGTPEQVRGDLRKYEEAAGAMDFHYIARLDWPGMDINHQRESMRLFANEVIPGVR